jgi:hypothetical protein
MSENVTRIIEGTFVVIILAWVLTHASEFGQVATSVGNVYTQGVQALSPSPSGYANPTYR